MTPEIEIKTPPDRLRKRSDFLAVSARGRKWVAKGMILIVAPNDGVKTRVGFTVTKKLEKTAVGRNRIKRRLRSVARDVFGVRASMGLDCVLIARPETAHRSYAALQQDLSWCLEKLGH